MFPFVNSQLFVEKRVLSRKPAREYCATFAGFRDPSFSCGGMNAGRLHPGVDPKSISPAFMMRRGVRASTAQLYPIGEIWGQAIIDKLQS
jgi:hypothetical protein